MGGAEEEAAEDGEKGRAGEEAAEGDGGEGGGAGEGRQGDVEGEEMEGAPVEDGNEGGEGSEAAKKDCREGGGVGEGERCEGEREDGEGGVGEGDGKDGEGGVGEGEGRGVEEEEVEGGPVNPAGAETTLGRRADRAVGREREDREQADRRRSVRMEGRVSISWWSWRPAWRVKWRRQDRRGRSVAAKERRAWRASRSERAAPEESTNEVTDSVSVEAKREVKESQDADGSPWRRK